MNDLFLACFLASLLASITIGVATALKLHDLMPLHERERILAMQPMRPCPHHPPEGRIEGP